MTKFAENANELVETEHSFFFMNFGYEPKMKFNITRVFNLQSIRERID